MVVSAGNSGYSSFITAAGKAEARYSDLSITDPGNADLAITVGSTHRDMPHIYGVSYFSSAARSTPGATIASIASSTSAESTVSAAAS